MWFSFFFFFPFASDADAGSELQRAAVVQKEKKRWLQWGDGGGREDWENPQMYRGESAVTEQQIRYALYMSKPLWLFIHADVYCMQMWCSDSKVKGQKQMTHVKPQKDIKCLLINQFTFVFS